MSPETLQSLKSSVQARAWACRHAVVCLDVPDDELYQQVVKTHRVDIYYYENTTTTTTTKQEEDEEPAKEPPEKKGRAEGQEQA